MTKATKSLHFVYNANSGKLNAVKDSLHKWLSPETYNCQLCTLTHSSFTEVAAWKEFRKQAKFEMHFYHKDEFEKTFKSKWLPKYNFPAVLLAQGEQLDLFIAAAEFDTIATVQDLIDRIAAKWQAIN